MKEAKGRIRLPAEDAGVSISGNREANAAVANIAGWITSPEKRQYPCRNTALKGRCVKLFTLFL